MVFHIHEINIDNDIFLRFLMHKQNLRKQYTIREKFIVFFQDCYLQNSGLVVSRREFSWNPMANSIEWGQISS